jgi:hypothetical protein
MTQENNPDCPYCHKPMCFNCTKPSGARQYRCRRGCLTPEGKIVTLTISDRKRGGQTIGDEPMTQAEYDLRYKLAHPEKYKEVHKYKPKTKDK